MAGALDKTYKTKAEADKVRRMLESVSRMKGSLKVVTRYQIVPK